MNSVSAVAPATEAGRRIRRFSGLSCIVTAAGCLLACGPAATATAPTPAQSGPTVSALAVTGNGRLSAPGETTQLVAEATLSDGSTKDVTSTVRWTSIDRTVATVSPNGLVTAIDLGKTTIVAFVGLTHVTAPDFAVTVLPEGTYILAGQVTDADSPINGVRVELVGGPMSGRVVMTDSFGRYAFNGVTGALQVRATKDGFPSAVRDVPPDTEHVNLVLTTGVPPADVEGTYRVTFTAAPSCQLPDDAMRRTYIAAIKQTGHRAIVTLSGAQFYGGDYCGAMNSADAEVHSNTVSLSNYAGDCGIVELLSEKRFFSLWGTAELVVTESGLAGPFAGLVRIAPGPPDGSPASTPTASCEAPDHQLVFERTLPATGQPPSTGLARARTK